MAGYRYPYRSQSPYDGFHPREAERSCDSDELCHFALDESEGRRVITGGPYQYPGTYVVKIEIERVHPYAFPELSRQRSPPRYEHRWSNGGVNNGQHWPSRPSNDQNEVSQPYGFGAPRAPYQFRIPVSTGYRGATGDAGDSDHEKGRHKPTSNPIKDEDPQADKILKPPVKTEGGNWPSPGNPAGSVLPSHPTSYEREPTIQGTATEYLKKVADPSSVNTIKDEAPDPSHLKGDKIPKPPVATEGGPAARPGHPRGSVPPNYYIPSERGERTIQPPSKTMTGGWERRGPDMGLEPRSETGKAVEYTKETVKPPPGSTVPKRDSNPETIDSNEARRRYGHLNPATEKYPTGNASTINSREAAKRYNGQFV